MRGKFIVLSASALLFSCTQKAPPPNWTAAMSSPYAYRVNGPYVSYFSKGRFVNGTSSTSIIGAASWGYPEPGRNMGPESRWPDSVFVSYYGLNDKLETWKYEGGGRLPANTIQKLFERGYDWDGEHTDCVYLTTGMAPGGRVCVWAEDFEVARFKVRPVEKWQDHPVRYTIDSVEERVIADYLKENPIEYSVWDKPDPRYEMEFYFCSELLNVDYQSSNLISREGTYEFIHENMHWEPCNIDKGFASYPDVGGYQQLSTASKRDHLLPFPSVFNLHWECDNRTLATSLPLERLRELYTTAYINPHTGHKVHYRRFLFKVVGDGTECEVYLVGPGRKTKVMRFKGLDALIASNQTINSGGFAKDIQWFLPDKAE